MSFSWILPAGRVTTQTYANTWSSADTAVTKEITVPTGKKWLLIQALAYHNDSVSREIRITIKDSSNNILSRIAASATSGQTVAFPCFQLGIHRTGFGLFILDEGMKIEFHLYAGSGGNASGTFTTNLWYLEVDT